MVLKIMVHGTPGPQGSKRFVGMSKKNHAILIESSRKVKPWREAVLVAARRACVTYALPAVAGPFTLVVDFYFKRPKSAPKRTHHTVYPDLSKLVRSTEDALTKAGIWKDDAQVVYIGARKLYIAENTQLQEPGCIIEIFWNEAY